MSDLLHMMRDSVWQKGQRPLQEVEGGSQHHRPRSCRLEFEYQGHSSQAVVDQVDVVDEAGLDPDWAFSGDEKRPLRRWTIALGARFEPHSKGSASAGCPDLLQTDDHWFSTS